MEENKPRRRARGADSVKSRRTENAVKINSVREMQSKSVSKNKTQKQINFRPKEANQR